MRISNELKERILSKYKACKPMLNKMIPDIKSEYPYVMCPIFIDGVIDNVRFNVKEKRFDQLEVKIATRGIMGAEWLNKHLAYCDSYEVVIIKL